MADVGRNDPCPCKSGKKLKFCCGDAKALKIYLFNHPRVPDIWDTKAINHERATTNFRAEWKRRVDLGLMSTMFKFEAGIVGRVCSEECCPESVHRVNDDEAAAEKEEEKLAEILPKPYDPEADADDEEDEDGPSLA